MKAGRSMLVSSLISSSTCTSESSRLPVLSRSNGSRLLKARTRFTRLPYSTGFPAPRMIRIRSLIYSLPSSWMSRRWNRSSLGLPLPRDVLADSEPVARTLADSEPAMRKLVACLGGTDARHAECRSSNAGHTECRSGITGCRSSRIGLSSQASGLRGVDSEQSSTEAFSAAFPALAAPLQAGGRSARSPFKSARKSEFSRTKS
mmetsp:Transcript_87922/g.257056  ORF Transcript_87922/g.257056 Transcript_87922/m.257056 type:complete len:204 (+) Transcript_87922:736-1347(+)